jgi:branched-chain amino acid transport system ATP-binding protein
VAILEIKNLTRRFGGLVAVNNLEFSINAGEIVALIGPNGAGKTTAFSMISGFQKPDSGSIVFDNRDITGLPPHLIAERGLARSFQIAEIFADMTVLDAVTTAALLRLPLRQAVIHADEVIARVGLKGRGQVSPSELSLQDRKLLELAKCVATRPKLILLDEVMAGLTLAEADLPVSIIRQLRDTGITFVLVEHVIPIVMKTADRIIVMNFGEKIAEGTPAEVLANQSVRDAYFGEELDA